MPLHLQLFDALGFDRIRYAHVAPLMKQDGSSRRKLSKRKDPEASVGYYIEQGYPAEAVQYYLRGLANGRLAELPLPEALATPLEPSTSFNAAGALVDLVKLDDISADYIATMPADAIMGQVATWAQAYDPALAEALAADPAWPAAPDIERVDVPTPARTCAGGPTSAPSTGSSSREIFEPVTDPADERFGGLAPDLVRRWPRRSRRTTATRARTSSGSTRSASSPPSWASPPTPRPTRRTRTPTPAPSAKPPRSSGSC